ncbi:thiamine phosphate synthase [Leptospira wolffii]|uniref:thiamine phosphate synthase n=1 Tax=Leptospira wolffii TaxID=409998 RepID=UPI00108441D8|nr:thiamine phosphate synthase [Leptospira wolffii]TGK60035.1 thiamine phosphate synthase [Leptospira wolffii]TGK72379.1 thiamine phosphate synthase [Leptospira wolffii]TGK76042.1 thiamine phosphate synthase [Leptospira wolffii]TGL30294.1 thiamine phosphate synthase [Leptospira wolffii]
MNPSVRRPRIGFWKSPGIYPILDLEYCSKYGKNPLQLASLWNRHKDVIPFYQLRAKKAQLREVREVYGSLILNFPDFPLILNDYWKEALDWEAFGLHIGKEDYQTLTESEKTSLHSSSLYLGTSCHTLEDLSHLVPGEWDYTGLGPIFPTGSKETEDVPTGESILSRALEILPDLPITPIGGIGPKEIKDILNISPFLFAMIASASEEEPFSECVEVLRKFRTLMDRNTDGF